MTGYIDTPTIGEILQEEFMEPMDISAYKLAQEIHVPVSRIQDILHDRRKITADTSLRLAKYFGVSDRYFLDMQNDIDIRNLKISLAEEINKIRVCQAVWRHTRIDSARLIVSLNHKTFRNLTLQYTKSLEYYTTAVELYRTVQASGMYDPQMDELNRIAANNWQ